MGPIQIQNASTKSGSRPSTRSTDTNANANPSTAPSKCSTSSDPQTSASAPRCHSHAKNDSVSTNGKNSALKRRAPSPPKRPSKARKSLNFDSEPVPAKSCADRNRKLELLLLDDNGGNLGNLNQLEPEPEPSTAAPDNWPQLLPPQSQSQPQLLSNDLITSSSLHSRRSQRITLKRLEGDQTSLKAVEAGPGPSVNFNIPLICSPPKSGTDQSSDYGTASERSFNNSQSQDGRTSAQTSTSAGESNSLRKRRRSKGTKGNIKYEKPPSPESLPSPGSPGYSSSEEYDLSDDDGYLDADTSNSQPWDDDLDAADITAENLSDLSLWDKLIEQEEDNSQHSFASDTSFMNYPPAARVRAGLISFRKIHLLAPLEGYELPSASGISTRLSTRSQEHGNLFCLDLVEETGSKLDKRGRSLMPRKSPFSIETFSNLVSDEYFARELGLRITAASPVISLKPFGTKLTPTFAAIVSILLDVVPAQDDEIFCLYSNSPPSASGRPPAVFEWKLWEDEHGTSKLNCENGRITLEISHFCYLLIVIRPKIEVTRTIRSRIGGKLHLPNNPDLVQVNFPKGSLQTDFTARMKVFLDTEMKLPDYFKKKPTMSASNLSLATPIIMVEPHGRKFNEPKCAENKNVTIQLPIPDYDYIMSKFCDLKPKLTLWQSCTQENEDCKWELLDTPYTITKVGRGTVIIFEVEHFSFFRAVWNIISASMYEARVGMSYWYPYVSFSMKCQANMQENESNRFGLEVICFRSDKILPEVTNYPHRVGSCNKPKLVKPGKIIIRMKSRFFEQDVEAGEDDNGMVKEENDFRGRDFEMQWALRFKEGVTVGRGTFGKVIVKRYVRQGEEEPLFEFNLQKTGCEGEQTPHDQSDRWSVLALQELAGNLFITVDDNWKIFAKEIGLTAAEIRHKVRPSPDRFLAILNLYQARGGTPNEFVTALYSVNRQLKLGAGTSPTNSKKSISSQGSSGLGSYEDRYGSDSDTSGTQISQDSVLNGSMRKRSNPSINRSKGSGSGNSKYKRPRRLPPPKPPKRRKDSSSGDESDQSEDEGAQSNASDGSVEDEDGANTGSKALSESTSILHCRDMTKLESSYLWELSAHLDTLTWRNLARTLGIDEATILNIEHQSKGMGFRECAYQMLLEWKGKWPKKCTYGTLYQALCKEGMNSVAKKMKTVTKND